MLRVIGIPEFDILACMMFRQTVSESRKNFAAIVRHNKTSENKTLFEKVQTPREAASPSTSGLCPFYVLVNRHRGTRSSIKREACANRHQNEGIVPIICVYAVRQQKGDMLYERLSPQPVLRQVINVVQRLRT